MTGRFVARNQGAGGNETELERRLARLYGGKTAGMDVKKDPKAAVGILEEVVTFMNQLRDDGKTGEANAIGREMTRLLLAKAAESEKELIEALSGNALKMKIAQIKKIDDKIEKLGMQFEDGTGVEVTRAYIERNSLVSEYNRIAEEQKKAMQTAKVYNMWAFGNTMDMGNYAEAFDMMYKAVKRFADAGHIDPAMQITISTSELAGKYWEYLKASGTPEEARTVLGLSADYSMKLVPVFDKELPELAAALIKIVAEVAVEGRDFKKMHEMIVKAAKAYKARGLADIEKDLLEFEARMSEFEKHPELKDDARCENCGGHCGGQCSG